VNEVAGLILFAHGARDERWRAPFEAIRAEVTKVHPGPVALAFLELMQPSLGEAARSLAEAGTSRAVVVPLFLGVGRHLREDLPGLAEEASRTSGCRLEIAAAAGENPDVIGALARYAISALDKHG